MTLKEWMIFLSFERTVEKQLKSLENFIFGVVKGQVMLYDERGHRFMTNCDTFCKGGYEDDEG